MDPINPISGNPGALNQKPSDNSTEQVNKSNGITIFSIALFILMSLGVIIFLYNQNQKLKAMLVSYQTPATSPTPVATTDPTSDWKTYTNSKYFYEFKCPPTSIHSVELSSGNGNDKPFYQEICSENQDQVRFYVYPLAHAQIASDGASVKEIISPAGLNKVVLRGFSQIYFDQILSTFKFISATPSAVPSTIPASTSSALPLKY